MVAIRKRAVHRNSPFVRRPKPLLLGTPTERVAAKQEDVFDMNTTSGTDREAALETHAPDALLAMQNVVLLPHTGSATVAARHAAVTHLRQNRIQQFSILGCS